MEKLKTSESEIFITQDKVYAPLLLACSFNRQITLIDSSTLNGVVYFKFSPKSIVEYLIDCYEVKNDVGVSLKDFVIAQEIFWKKVYATKAS